MDYYKLHELLVKLNVRYQEVIFTKSELEPKNISYKYMYLTVKNEQLLIILIEEKDEKKMNEKEFTQFIDFINFSRGEMKKISITNKYINYNNKYGENPLIISYKLLAKMKNENIKFCLLPIRAMN